MNIYSDEGVRLYGYNNTNSGNCGIRTFAISRNFTSYSGYVTLINFLYDQSPYYTGFSIQSHASVIPNTTASSSVYTEEKRASYIFNGTGNSNAGAYDANIQTIGSFAGQPGDIGYSFTTGSGTNACIIKGRGLNHPCSLAITVHIFCTHWNRFTISYP